MKLKTRWEKCSIPYFNDKNKIFFSDEIGFLGF